MLNYFQRIDSFKRRNYFQVNGQFLDIYGPKLSEWAQNFDTVKDILQYASSIDLQDHYDILNIRIIADYNIMDREALLSTIVTANQLLAEELGESEVWKDVKPAGAPKRHFLTTVFVIAPPSTRIESNNEETTQRKPKAVRVASPDKDAV